MKVKLIPGPRDEEKIAAVQNARKTLSEEDYAMFVLDCCESDEKNAWFDAIYYADQSVDAGIKEQEEYFNWMLENDELLYFVTRLGGAGY